MAGAVTDAHSGEPLPAAHVQVEGSNHGTTTNADGRFEIYLERTPAVLVARYVGYRSARVEVGLGDRFVEIALTPETVQLEEIVVSGEDPAVDIMRRVIARKRTWADSLVSFRAEGYTRFLLYRGLDLVQLREWSTETYWRAGAGPREIVRATRRRPAGVADFRFAGPEAVPNFYDDTIRLQGVTFTGPTHPDALALYTFRVGTPLVVDGRRVAVVYVTPSSRLQAAFVGRLLVLEDEDALLSVYLRPAWHMIPPPPIRERVVHYEQHFERTIEGFRLPVDARIEGSVRFGRAGASYPEARFTQVSRLTYHVPNWPAPDSLFAGDRSVFFEPFSGSREYLFGGNPAYVPPSQAESDAIGRMNPRLRLADVFRPTGLMAGYGGVRIEETPAVQAQLADEPALLRRPRLWAWYNRVDGAHPGARIQVVPGERMRLDLAAGYAWERRRLTGSVEAELDLLGSAEDSGALTVRLGAADQTASTYASRTYSPIVNGVTTYFGFDDYFDYYRRRALTTDLRFRYRLLRLDTGFEWERHSGLSRRVDYEGWWKENVQRENPDVLAGRVPAARLRFVVGSEIGASLLPPGRGLSAEVRLAPDGFAGDSPTFSTVDLTGLWEVHTLWRRRPVPPSLRLLGRLWVTGGAPPPQYRGAVDVAVGPLAPFGALRATEGLPYAGERLAALSWEQSLGTIPFELLRLGGLAERGLEMILHGAHARVWESNGAAGDRSPASAAGHHELGVSLAEIFRYPVRVDFTWRLDQPAFRLGFGVTAAQFRTLRR